jgi:hypothetical protein
MRTDSSEHYIHRKTGCCASLDQHLRCWARILVPDRCESGDATVKQSTWIVLCPLQLTSLRESVGAADAAGAISVATRFSTGARLGGAADSYLAFGLGLCTKNMWKSGSDDDKQRLFLELGKPSPFDRFIRSCRSFPQSKTLANPILYGVLRT